MKSQAFIGSMDFWESVKTESVNLIKISKPPIKGPLFRQLKKNASISNGVLTSEVIVSLPILMKIRSAFRYLDSICRNVKAFSIESCNPECTVRIKTKNIGIENRMGDKALIRVVSIY